MKDGLSLFGRKSEHSTVGQARERGAEADKVKTVSSLDGQVSVLTSSRGES